MGGRGSGGRRSGSGRKKLSDLQRAIGGNAGKRGRVLNHPNSTAASTSVAPVTTFDPPLELQSRASELANLMSQLAFLQQAAGPDEPNPQIAELQAQILELRGRAQALAIWHELAPSAFAARTLTPATTAAFVMLCRAIVAERALSASPASASGPNHRGLMARVATWMKDFSLAPLGKPLYEAEAPKANPLESVHENARMTKSPRLDPATAYATHVVAGAIIAGRLVRLACARHLDDLERQDEKGLVWRPDDAQEALDFFEQILCLPEETDVDEDVEANADRMPEQGTPFRLSPFQAFIVANLFGWHAYTVGKNTSVRRLQQRFRIAYFEGGKGCGKTPMGAGILLFMLVRHGVRGSQIFCSAVTKEQAKLAFADCLKMVAASPALQQLITVLGNNLSVKATGSFIRPLSSEKRGLDGKRVQAAVVDELHEHPSATVLAKLKAGIKGRPDALIFLPTNSGFDRTSICWEYHEKSRGVLEGTIVDEAWFAYVCQLDPCEKHEAEGKPAPVDGCPDCDDWTTEGPHWLKANPNLGVSIPWQYLREQVRDAIQVPSQRNLVMRLNFCLWTDQATVWITRAAWAACRTTLERDAFAESLRGRACYLGIDLSDKIDLTSVQAIFPRAIAREADLTIEPVGGAPVPVDHAIDVLSYFWMPKASLARRGQEDGMPYADWADQGFLTATAGQMVDHDAVVDFILAFAERYQLKGIGIDQAGASAVITRLRRHFGDDFVQEIKQGFTRLNTPSRMIEALVLSQNLTHDGSPVQAMCMGHMAIDENTWREIRPIKISQRKRIDGGVALIDAEAAFLEAGPSGDEASDDFASRGLYV